MSKRAPSESTPDPPGSLQFSIANAVLGGLGLVLVILGYYLLAQGSITAAPILLVVGYVILMPMAIII